MFTLEQIEEIHRKLQLFGVKDKDLPILTEQLNGNEIITVVKDGRNVQLLISQLLDFNSFTPEQLESLRGPRGNDGKDAYQTWLSQGNVGTYDDYIAVLQLPALLAAETSTIRVNNKLNEADVVIEELNSLSNQTQESLSEMNNAKDLAYETVTHPPVIIDKYWHSWNHETNQYDTTYIKAEGDDAYEVWLDAGNVGTLEDYLEDIKGDTGNYGVVEFVINENMELEQHTLIGDPLDFEIVDGDLVLNEAGETVNLGTVANKDTYSYDEIRIGTWVNGKPIYRKVILLDISMVISDSIILLHYLNVDEYIRMDIASNQKDFQMIPVSTLQIGNNAGLYIGAFDVNSDTIYLNEIVYNYTDTTYHLILEYTKL